MRKNEKYFDLANIEGRMYFYSNEKREIYFVDRNKEEKTSTKFPFKTVIPFVGVVTYSVSKNWKLSQVEFSMGGFILINIIIGFLLAILLQRWAEKKFKIFLAQNRLERYDGTNCEVVIKEIRKTIRGLSMWLIVLCFTLLGLTISIIMEKSIVPIMSYAIVWFVFFISLFQCPFRQKRRAIKLLKKNIRLKLYNEKR